MGVVVGGASLSGCGGRSRNGWSGGRDLCLKPLPLFRLWSVEESSPVCVLPHPCYVYSVCFSSAELLFTGAFDRCIRVWSVTAERAQVGCTYCSIVILFQGFVRGIICVALPTADGGATRLSGAG